MLRTRLLPFAAAVLFLLAGSSSAHAGQYTLAYDFASDLSGWGGYVEPGYLLCGHGATAGCPDVSTNRILAHAGSPQAIWSQGRWEWAAPAGTTIAGGALTYRTRMRNPQFFARVKMRADGSTWDAAPAIVSEQQTVALTDHVVALPGGFRQIGVALYAHPAVSGVVIDAWDDYVTLVRLDVTVDDPTPPGLAWVDGGGLLDGAWHRGDACATVAIADGQSGVGSVWLASDGASAAWGAPATGSQYQPGPASAQPGLCLAAGALADGVHAGAVGGADASGGQAAALPFTLRIDRTPPAGRLVAPEAEGASERPPVELDVADATSGVAGASAQIDGVNVPLDLSAGRASGRPPAALSYGPHALTWAVVDQAGNRSEGSAQFAVADATPPALGAPEPAAGSALADGEVLSVVVAVSDDGSGVDPASPALDVDGSPVEHVWLAAGVIHGVVGRRLAAGVHHLALRVADRAGNLAHLAWDVSAAAGAGAPAGTAGSTPATTAGAAGPAGRAARARAAVRVLAPRVHALRPRAVIIRLRARPHLRIGLSIRCGKVVRTVRVRASAHGNASVRILCAGVATVRIAGPPSRLLVHIAARRLPLRLHVRPERRFAPTVARVSGKLPELRGRIVVLQALTAEGWKRVTTARADASGAFTASFAIVHAGQFAVRALVPAVAARASLPFVLTMR